ncbi:hypothetical protein GXM_00029 [Nostoc sphaeroides CCNUC1]|uniref:Uncharacterized protein n=1 Tax=Nostoc sphaeroides CCNUC1 TaxID=2653204 RepID=A0A5P8VQQ1_9NOSO|nr:hypothetical protein GXM_00029 [Nostoc sphaeroides CCNUC1]
MILTDAEVPTLTGSQPLGWEPILLGSASSSLTIGSSPF